MDILVIHGRRLAALLNEESTYSDLYRGIERSFPNTKKRQYATGPISVLKTEYLPFVNDNSLRVNTLVNSSGNRYQPVIMFRNVTFQDENLPTNTTFTAVDGNEYNIQSIPLSGSVVRVHCNCLDFYWRFASWNYSDGSLEGDPPPPYNATGQRPPVNPEQTPGVCKHIIKVVGQLKTARIVT